MAVAGLFPHCKSLPSFRSRQKLNIPRFEYFERLGDTQMLGMLSCIFYEPQLNKDLQKDRYRRRRASVLLHDKVLPLGYGSSPEDSRAKSQLVIPLTSTTTQTTSPFQSSVCSPAEHWQADGSPLHSTGTTPPSGAHSHKISTTRTSQLHNFPLSGSLEHPSNSRPGYNFGVTLASSLSRSFTFSPSMSSSPPSNSSKKRPSPSESLNISGPSGWSTSGFFGKSASAIADYPTASTNTTSQPHSDTESERQESLISCKSSRRIKVTMKNQGAFDNDGHAYVPLLDPRRESLYRAYRAAYADLLFVWGMPLEGRIVLKIEGIAETYPHLFHRSQQVDAASVFNRRNSGLSMPVTVLQDYQQKENRGLDLQRHCTKCGQSLNVSVFSSPSLGKGGHKNKVSTSPPALNCPQCKPKQSLTATISCAICNEMVYGMFTPCLKCGHVSCVECHRQWFSPKPPQDIVAKDKKTAGMPSCATGCGCKCFEHVIIQVPMPTIPVALTEDKLENKKPSRSRSRRPLQLNRHRGRQSFETPSRNEGDHGDMSAGASFVSLAARGFNLDLQQRMNGLRKSGTAFSIGPA